MPQLCPCCSERSYEQCCQPFLEEKTIPQTPEQLMRSRYTAYSQAQIPYIKKTMTGKPLLHFDENEAARWAQSVVWLGLKIVDSSVENEERGFVEFIASFLEKNQVKTICERSEFHQHNKHWFYVDGVNTATKKPAIKIGRNSICPCGSGKKFKNCHEQ
ncbi:YchJ family protein [Legionella sp. km772]|uniref:YchJ family protein n=1 Tax=Legionella sp. km772 TaxID=2498111 RepID=UPI000F8DE3AC|nr:YchJ family protein [Legionella sp. km772]RUR09999.1 YchJ family protein [Legionella sp. km772]